jgi:hypothetical protein
MLLEKLLSLQIVLKIRAETAMRRNYHRTQALSITKSHAPPAIDQAWSQFRGAGKA